MAGNQTFHYKLILKDHMNPNRVLFKSVLERMHLPSEKHVILAIILFAS